MPAARILALARTRRCAMVGSGTRKARAISPVSRPPSSRRVRATWALTASEGWQQVKIRRSRSSRTATSSECPSSPAWMLCASAWRSSREASRRRRSIARLRAVVMIQPAGLGGTPMDGQRCTATAKASWTASSARSMSPKTRRSTATARPYCSRNICSISPRGAATSPSGLFEVILERPDLDRGGARNGGLCGPGEGSVEVGDLDDPEAPDMLLALGEGTVGGEHVAVLHFDDRCGGRRVQTSREHPHASRLQLGVNGLDIRVHLLEHLGRRHGASFDVVHGKHVLLHWTLLSWLVCFTWSGLVAQPNY